MALYFYKIDIINSPIRLKQDFISVYSPAAKNDGTIVLSH